MTTPKLSSILPPELADLAPLASNLRSTWDPGVRALFASLDPGVWAASRGNPLAVVHALPASRVDELARDDAFVERVRAAWADLERYLEAPRWYATLPSRPRSIAYFSPEFAVSEMLPQYSGGLGVLAGDHLKAASDLGVPLIGVGLLYRCGYFEQSVSADGRQEERYVELDRDDLPLEPVLGGDGEPVRVTVAYPDGPVHAQVLRLRVGRVPLLLLDTDLPDNRPEDRDITDRLYGGDNEQRLRQEIMLGIGGLRAVEAAGQAPDVLHLNEGHAGFLGLERLRRCREQGLDLAAAVEKVREGAVFTTHTPVPAGIDRFPRHLMARYFGPGALDLGLSIDELMGLGAEPDGDGGTFNMAMMSLRLAGRANGVSRLHGEVARGMFARVWPDLEECEVPIGHITNGVHEDTWVAPEALALYGEALRGPGPTTAVGVDDDALWEARRVLRGRLVDDVRTRLRDAASARGEAAGWIDEAFDPEILTVGFARRVPQYKRLTLILRDADRLRRLLLDPERPIQLLVAGKAHPADTPGKEMIRQFLAFASDPSVRHRIAFVPNYDMALGRSLVTGADVWLNNPLRPLEACGTSGMKAALNGGLNLSIRDGWWDELYDGENGWAIPSAEAATDPDQRDDDEARAILDLLEQAVVPLFYDREGGVPRGWLDKVRRSLGTIGPEVLAARMVRDYTEQLYVPAAAGVGTALAPR
jgi:starch phosphorylase